MQSQRAVTASSLYFTLLEEADGLGEDSVYLSEENTVAGFLGQLNQVGECVQSWTPLPGSSSLLSLDSSIVNRGCSFAAGWANCSSIHSKLVSLNSIMIPIINKSNEIKKMISIIRNYNVY